MRHVLVLQWVGTSEVQFDELIEMEDELEQALAAGATVDGHDFESGAMNIFIETDQPSRTFADAQAILRHRPKWADVRGAYREADGDAYTALWPVEQTEFRVK
jgi:hypothetical protein